MAPHGAGRSTSIRLNCEGPTGSAVAALCTGTSYLPALSLDFGSRPGVACTPAAGTCGSPSLTPCTTCAGRGDGGSLRACLARAVALRPCAALPCIGADGLYRAGVGSRRPKCAARASAVHPNEWRAVRQRTEAATIPTPGVALVQRRPVVGIDRLRGTGRRWLDGSRWVRLPRLPQAASWQAQLDAPVDGFDRTVLVHPCAPLDDQSERGSRSAACRNSWAMRSAPGPA